MKFFRLTAYILLPFIAIAIWIWANEATYVYRYRLTFELEVDGALKTGTGVIEVHHNISTWSLVTSSAGARGQAVIIDLGEKGLLFATLQGHDNADTRASTAFTALIGSPGSVYDTKKRLKALTTLKASAELTQKTMPLLVRFKTISDPATVERVDPYNLAKTYGDDVKLKRATIEMTKDDVTIGIEQTLTWLDAPFDQSRKLFKGPYWDRQAQGASSLETLDSYTFRQGRLLK